MDSKLANENRVLAHRVLVALCDSSLADEMNFYREAIQNDLNLTDEQMLRVYNLKAICHYLSPDLEIHRPIQKFYKGKPVKDNPLQFSQYCLPVPSTDTSKMSTPSRLECNTENQTETNATNVETENQTETKGTNAETVPTENNQTKETYIIVLENMCRSNGIFIDRLRIDDESYDRFVAIRSTTNYPIGHGLREKFRRIGGIYNKSSGCILFDRKKLSGNDDEGNVRVKE